MGRSVGLICPDSSSDAVAEQFQRRSVIFSDARRGSLGASINLVPCSLAKGLEFDAVVVLNPSEIAKESMHGLRLLFISLTRTTRDLTIVFDELPDELSINGFSRSAQRDTASRNQSEVGPNRFTDLIVDKMVEFVVDLQPGAQLQVIRELVRRLGISLDD